ncbi:unnamed protein product [Paramecium primaurelia]|uniref:Protein kinase domain-containing protein n=1 Tax=Paramecium primaurelia TaxID=5886 RepID=A0A8S1MNK2_PARPR|nr:unnamed protein product [Paramecium primaurelia]
MRKNQKILSPFNEFKDRCFVILECLGQGIDGEVYEARVENQSYYEQNVAIKFYKNINQREEQFIDSILEQKQNNLHEYNQFLVQIYEKIKVQNEILVVMELGQCSLKEYLSKNQLSFDEKNQICLQISKSIQFLHNQNYFHRDIKPENFVKINNQFKLTDFGLIKQSLQTERIPTICGTQQYQAPEIQDEIYSQEIDIWSLACVFYEIIQGEELIQGYKEKQVKYNKKDLLNNIEDNIQIQKMKYSQIPQWSNLIIKMLNQNPKYRPNILQVVNEIENIQQINIEDNIIINPQNEQIQLQEYLNQNNNLSQQEKESIILDISKSILHLHNKGYYHTNIHLNMFQKYNNHWVLVESDSNKRDQSFNYSELDPKSIDIFRLGCLFYYILLGKIVSDIRKVKVNQNLQIKSDIDSYTTDKDTFLTKIQQIKSEKWQKLILHMLESIEDTSLSLQEIIQVCISQNVNSLIDAPTQEFPKRYFILTKLLGDGREGGVYQATPKNEKFYNKDIAFKIQYKMKDHEIQFIDFLIDYQKNQELNQFIKSNLIKVYERFVSQGQQVLIMELGGKDLFSVLNTKLQIEQKIKICQEISQSIAFLHKQQLIHRDIKPENFIQVGTTFKLIDFGLIQKKEENIRHAKMIGSPLYQAPEIINGSENYQASVDIWSLGCLFFELFQGEPLFDGQTLQELYQQILNYCKNQQKFHLKINQLQIKQELKTLIKQMIDPIPDKRPNIDYVQKELLPKFLSNPAQFIWKKSI